MLKCQTGSNIWIHFNALTPLLTVKTVLKSWDFLTGNTENSCPVNSLCGEIGLVPYVRWKNESTSLTEGCWTVTYDRDPIANTRWNPQSESWGHWEVSDRNVGWHHSDVSMPWWTAEFDCLKLPVMNESTALECVCGWGWMLSFTQIPIFSPQH